MSMSDRKKIGTVPNIISLIRICLIVPFVILFMGDNYVPAAAVILISGLTDMFDGVIARKFDQISDLGLLLDPLADKLTLVAVLICVSLKITDILPLTVILLIKELLMLLGGIYLIKNKIKVPPSRWYGKLATVLFYISAVVLVYMKAVLNYENKILTFALVLITTVAMIFALIMYIKLFFEVLDEHAKAEELKGAK